MRRLAPRAARLGIAAAAVLIFVVHPLQAQSTESVLYKFLGATVTPADGAAPFRNLLRDGVRQPLRHYGMRHRFRRWRNRVRAGQLPPGTYTEKVLYSFTPSFTGISDGTCPSGGVVMDSSGNLYGTTTLGGAFSDGTVFELVNSSGSYAEKILYSFMGEFMGAGMVNNPQVWLWTHWVTFTAPPHSAATASERCSSWSTPPETIQRRCCIASTPSPAPTSMVDSPTQV